MADQDIAQLTGLPEIHASALTADLLTRAIADHGALIVRELISPDRVAELDEAFLNAFAAAAAANPRENDPIWSTWATAFGAGEDRSAWYTPYEDGTGATQSTRFWVHSAHCALIADSPAMLSRITRIYREAGIFDLVSRHLGEVPVLSSQKSTMRRTLSNIWASDNWHQDGAFLGSNTRVVNVWLALTHCGERAASVEIGTTRQTRIIPPGDGSNYSWSVGPEEAAAASPNSVTAICAPGDAVLFDHLCLHRTSGNPEYSEERRALETWLFAPSTYPREFDPRPIDL